MLDRLAEENNGIPEYLLPDEDIEVKVSHFASKINYPALSNLELTFSGNNVYDIYPNKLGDLFYGSETLIAGRYRKSGKTTAVLTGKIGNKNKTFEFPIRFNEGDINDEYIALLWANRRVGYLIQELRLHGSNQELLSEVISLSKKFGIVTEYTSFLVTGDEHYTADDFWRMPEEEARMKLKVSSRALREYDTGKSGVMQAKRAQKLMNAPAASAPSEVYVNEKEVKIDNTRQVGADNFYKAENNWIQSDITDDKFDIEIKRFSKAYFQIVEQDPSAGRYMAIGDNVRFKVGEKVVQISDTGKEELSDKELDWLFK